jgi:hypothetical protein
MGGEWVSTEPADYTLSIDENPLATDGGQTGYTGVLGTTDGLEYPAALWGAQGDVSTIAVYSPPPYFIEPVLASVDVSSDVLRTSYAASDMGQLATVHLFLRDDALAADVERLQRDLVGYDATLEVTYVSEQQGAASFAAAQSDRPALVMQTAEQPLARLDVQLASPTAVGAFKSWLLTTPAWTSVMADAANPGRAVLVDLPGQWADAVFARQK